MKPRRTSHLSFPLASAIAALLAAHSAQAATYYWDNSPGVLGFGTALGTWSATTDPALNSPVGTGWSTSSTGAAATVIATVTTGTADAINFGNATASSFLAGTISVGTVNSGSITFGSQANGIVLSGGTITLAAATNLTVSGGTAVNTIGSVLAGAGTSLTKAGAGGLVLSGANTYTGKTAITAGTLSINSIKGVGGVANSLGMPLLADATIAVGATTAAGTLSYFGVGDTTDRVINLAGTSGGTTLDQSGTSGSLKFTSALNATGVGSKTLTLQGSTAGTGEIGGALVNNSTIGSTIITSTFLNAATTAVLASVDGVSVGATISGTGIAGSIISAINTTTRTVTFGPPATAASGVVGTSYTVTGVENRTALTKAGSGTWALSGANLYTGRTSVNAGTLILGFGAVASDIISASSALTLGGGTLQLTGTGTQTLNGLTTTASTSSRILLGADETLTLGALTAAGAGSSLNFNTIAGGANATTPAVGTGIAVLTGITPGNTIASGFTVSDIGGFGLATVNGSNQVVRQTSSTLLPDFGAIATTDYRVDNNAGGNTDDGSSSLVISASQSTLSVTVDTTAANGVLTLDSGFVLSNNVWHFGGTGTHTYQITGSASGAGLNSVATGNTININNYNSGLVTIASPILAFGVNPVNLNGTGTTVFSGSNTYTGLTTVKAGTLKVTGGTSVIGALSVGTAAYQQDSSNSVSSVTLTGTCDLNIGTTGTATFTLNDGTFTVTGSPSAAGNIGANGVATFTQTGGLFSYAPTAGNTVLNIGVAVTGSGTVNLSGGIFQTAANIQVYLGGRQTSVMNISGTALVDIPDFRFNRNLNTAHTATLNLGDGTLGSGTLKVSTMIKDSPAAHNVSIFNFNGGTLQAGISSAAFMSGLTTANVKDGGAFIDTNTFDITLAQPLLHFAAATTDSLTKNGTGTLTLSGVNTYTGNTTVSDGTLELATTGQLKFLLGATSGVNNSLTGSGTATLKGSFAIDTSAADALSSGTWTLENVSTLTGAYDPAFSVSGFVDAGSNKWTKANGATKTYTFDETTGILTLTSASGYSAWQTANSTAQTMDLDHDNDGVANGVEYFLGGNTNTTGFTPLPGVTNTAGTLSVTWTKAATGYAGTYGPDFVVETSATLTGAWTTELADPTPGFTVTFPSALEVKFTFPAGTKNFARLKVTGP